MASKQPFKFFDWKQKLTRLYLRLNKTIAHRVLAKSRNALLLDYDISPDNSGLEFGNKLRKKLNKTWEIYDLNLNDKSLWKHNTYNSKEIE